MGYYTDKYKHKSHVVYDNIMYVLRSWNRAYVRTGHSGRIFVVRVSLPDPENPDNDKDFCVVIDEKISTFSQENAKDRAEQIN